MLTRALSWSLAGAVAGMLAQIALMAALSRLLSPRDFGLMAATTLATRFVSYLSNAGIGPALIQRATLVPGHHAAALRAALAIGIVCWIGFAALALPIAAFFRDPALAPVLAVAPAAMFAAAMASVPQALLRRGLRFKALAACDLLSLVLGYALTSIVLASLGYGVWSLVFGIIAQQFVLFVCTAALARPSWRATAEPHHFKDLLGYGTRYSGVGLLDFLSSNVETLFVGRYLGTNELGLYNRVASITSMPIELAMSAIHKVTFPALAQIRAQGDPLSPAVLMSLRLCTLVTIPAAFGMSACAEGLVLTVLGPKWTDAIAVTQILVWGIPAVYISAFAGSAIDVGAEFGRKALLIVAVSLCKLGLMFTLGVHGLVWVTMAMVCAEWLRALGMLILLKGRTGIATSASLATPQFGIWVGLAVLAAVTGTEALAKALSHVTTTAGWPFALQLVAAVLAFLGCARLALRPIIARGEASGLELKLMRRLAFAGSR
jgi:O-antigen/teichoic acid export membrane protein